MAQISKGDTFTDGQQVTGARLNQLVDSSVLLTGAITEQPALTAATLASDDLVIISDTSASALRKATVNDILGSSLPIVASTVTATTVTTSTLNAGANSDILITPNDGANVTGKTFSSADGITATVASTAHGLVTGQNVTITASNSAYSGTYKITVTTVDAFTYVLVPTSTAASGTCSYVREGSVRINGELNVSGGLNVNGNVVTNGTTIQNGAVTSTTLTANLTTTSTAITQAVTDASTKIATTAFVNNMIPIKAWVNFNGMGATSTNMTINSSFNVSSVFCNGTGMYTINFTTAMTDANYLVLANAQTYLYNGSPTLGVYSDGTIGSAALEKTTAKVRISSQKDSTGAFVSQPNISVLILR